MHVSFVSAVQSILLALTLLVHHSSGLLARHRENDHHVVLQRDTATDTGAIKLLSGATGMYLCVGPDGTLMANGSREESATFRAQQRDAFFVLECPNRNTTFVTSHEGSFKCMDSLIDGTLFIMEMGAMRDVIGGCYLAFDPELFNTVSNYCQQQYHQQPSYAQMIIDQDH